MAKSRAMLVKKNLIFRSAAKQSERGTVESLAKKFGWHSKKCHGQGALKEREEVAQKQEQFLLQHSFS